MALNRGSRLLQAFSLLSLLAIFSACSDSDNEQTSENAAPTASARVATEADLLSGPLARGVPGDFVLENENLRVIIQKAGRQWLSIGTFGGNIIDVSRKDAAGGMLPDHLEEFVIGLNIENTPNYTDIRVQNDGSDGAPAVICAAGPDDLLELANPSSAVSSFGVTLPTAADDKDLPVDIETCYSLAVGDKYVVLDSTFKNSSSELDVFMTEWINGSGQVEFFQGYAGFGDPTLTPSCPEEMYVACEARDEGVCDPCNFVAYGGVDDAEGVSYGLIHNEQGSSSFSQVGVNIVVYGSSAAELLVGLEPANYTIPGDGALSLRRYFAVGDGTIASIADIRNDIFGIEAVAVSGTVSSAGEPLQSAQIVVYQVLDADANPPTLFVVNHSRTDAAGEYKLSVPPGNYQIRANMEGYRFPDNAPLALAVKADAAVTRDFDMPPSGFLEVTVIDEIGPGPAKLQLVGLDPSPPQTNVVATLIGGQEAGLFSDYKADGLPFGIAQVTFIDREGASERITMEPGNYQLVISRGISYSAYKEDITITAGQVTTVQAEIVKVIDDSGFVQSDFHVHSIDSPDSEVRREERVMVMLAEGIEFFTPSDHGSRSDFGPILQAMGVEDLIGVAVGSEITTFDSGHYNAWPLTRDPNSISGGAFDWAGAAPPGLDFPRYGHYNLSPAEIMLGLHGDLNDTVVVQINHIASYFGADGLAIDTGKTPPESSSNLAEKRLDPSIGNAFDDGFDVLEVIIGASLQGGIEGEFIGSNAGDWFNLINQDIVRIGVANSDTHNFRNTYNSARTLIANETTNPLEVAADPEALAANLLAGRAFGTNGPLVLLQADGQFNGAMQRAGLRIDEAVTMAADVGSDVLLTVTVATPKWAPVDTIKFYINNQPARTTDADEAARYRICANAQIRAGDERWEEVEVVVNDSVSGGSRIEVTATLTLEAITADTWIVVTAGGTNGVSTPVYPVYPGSLNRDSNRTLADLTDGNLGESGILAFGFTNPLFIDVEGDGWRPPGVANASCSEPP